MTLFCRPLWNTLCTLNDCNLLPTSYMQKLGGNAMLVDAEHAFDPAYSKALGVDIENLIVCQPDNGEMALESNTACTLGLG